MATFVSQTTNQTSTDMNLKDFSALVQDAKVKDQEVTIARNLLIKGIAAIITEKPIYSVFVKNGYILVGHITNETIHPYQLLASDHFLDTQGRKVPLSHLTTHALLETSARLEKLYQDGLKVYPESEAPVATQYTPNS